MHCFLSEIFSFLSFFFLPCEIGRFVQTKVPRLARNEINRSNVRHETIREKKSGSQPIFYGSCGRYPKGNNYKLLRICLCKDSFYTPKRVSTLEGEYLEIHVSLKRCICVSYYRLHLPKCSPLPTLVVPGDNDWYDCPNRTESFGFFLEHFSALETRWHKKDYESLGIKRSIENPELFVFYKEGVLFIGLHLINAPIEHEDIEHWDARMRMNTEWVGLNIELYFQKFEIRGVILLGHCLRSPRTRPFFLSVADSFLNITHRENVPVLYLHGDGHNWDIDTKLSHQLHWKHFRDVQVDQGGLADPVIVDIAPQKKGKLKGLKQRNDLEVVFGRGLFRIDRQRGLYDNPKIIDQGNN